MFSFIYNCLLFFFVLFTLPKFLWQCLVHGKYKGSLSARLGFKLPPLSSQKEVIWLHAVSMGETRALLPLYRLIREKRPQAQIVISTTTETGQAEAKRVMPDAAAHFYLPPDFSWIIKRFVRAIRPTLLILCESDFWYHLLKITHDSGAKICLVNGKVSERSCKRFKTFPFFTKRLFSNFDLLCVQTDLYKERFLSMGIPLYKLCVTGNLKFDAPIVPLTAQQRQTLCNHLKILPTDHLVVIGSTHAPEEELLLKAMESIKIPHLKILIVPRHPERFQEVADLLKKRGVAFSRYSEANPQEASLILIDAMGLLNQCYQLAEVAIVAGSFASHIGGHNVFEPVLYGIPTLFGPHMHGQIELKDLVLEAKAGIQVTLDTLPTILQDLLENGKTRAVFQENGKQLAAKASGVAARIYEKIEAIS